MLSLRWMHFRKYDSVGQAWWYDMFRTGLRPGQNLQGQHPFLQDVPKKLFGEMLQLLNTGGVKKALTGKKQLLLSLVAPKYRHVNEEDGKSIWTKEVAQIFGKVLDSIPNAKMRGE